VNLFAPGNPVLALIEDLVNLQKKISILPFKHSKKGFLSPYVISVCSKSWHRLKNGQEQDN
jgi:hypothetical protein